MSPHGIRLAPCLMLLVGALGGCPEPEETSGLVHPKPTGTKAQEQVTTASPDADNRPPSPLPTPVATPSPTPTPTLAPLVAPVPTGTPVPTDPTPSPTPFNPQGPGLPGIGT